MRLLVLLLLCISSVVLVEGGRRRRRWIARRRRRWNPVRAVSRAAARHCPTKWWKISGVNILKYERCVKFTIYWDGLWAQLARPFGNMASIIGKVVTQMGNFFKDMGAAIKEFFNALGRSLSNALGKMVMGLKRTLERAWKPIERFFHQIGRYARDVVRAADYILNGRFFAEVSSERAKTESVSGNICGNAGGGKYANSIIKFWDCGIGSSFRNVKNGPGNINKVGWWIGTTSNFFNDIARKLRYCVKPHKKCSAFGVFWSVFPFIAVNKTNMCIFSIFERGVVNTIKKTKDRIDRWMKGMFNLLKHAFKQVCKAMGAPNAFGALSVSRSNSGDCQNNARMSHRNYFGFEWYFDLMPYIHKLRAQCFKAGGIWTGAARFLTMFWVVGVAMASVRVDVFIIFLRFGAVAGATCGHRWGYGWCCPMWLFAYENNFATLFIPVRSWKEYVEKLEPKFTMRLCFLPRWNVAWNSNCLISFVHFTGASMAQFGMCHGPGLKFLLSDALAKKKPEIFGTWPGNALCVVCCIILGFEWGQKNCVQTYCFGVLNTDKTPDPPEDIPANLMYDLWCGYIDICFGHRGCWNAKDRKYGGRR